MKFDVLIENPPFNDEKNIDGTAITKGKGNKIVWDKFVLKSLEHLKENGYLCIVHPALWRKPEYYLWDIISKKQIKYLEIHNTQDGLKTFNMSTRYDWYVLQNKEYESKTEVVDEHGKKFNIDLRKWKFLPNFDYKKVEKYLAKNGEKTCDIIFDRSAYGTDKKHLNWEKEDKFKYPVIYKIYKDGGINFIYSSINTNGHFTIPKIIISKEVGGSKKMSPPINDFKGEYAVAQFCFAIPVKNKKDGDLLIKFLTSDEFNEMSFMWNTVELDYRIFKYFKKDFWKYFVDENGNEI